MAVQLILTLPLRMAASGMIRGKISSLMGQVPKGIKLDVKTNIKQVDKKLKRTQSFLPRIFDKGLNKQDFIY